MMCVKCKLLYHSNGSTSSYVAIVILSTARWVGWALAASADVTQVLSSSHTNVIFMAKTSHSAVCKYPVYVIHDCS